MSEEKNEQDQQDNDEIATTTQLSAEALIEFENIVKSICTASKLLRLYPANNPIPAQALDKLYSLLLSYLEKEGELRLSILKDRIVIASKPIGEDNEAITNLAGELYNRNLNQVIFYIGLSRDEVANFLTIIGLEADVIKSQGGLDSLLWEKEVANISVEETVRKIIELETTTSSGPGEPQVQETVSMSDVKRIASMLKRASSANPGELKVLAKLVFAPQETASFLSGLSRLPTDKDGEAEITRLDQLSWSLGKLNDVISSEAPSLQPALYRNLAEAVLSLDEQTRLELLEEKIFPAVSQDPIAGNLIAQLSPTELADNISRIASKDPSRTEQIVNALGKAGLAQETKNEILELLSKQLADSGTVLEKLAQLKEPAKKTEIPVETLKPEEEGPKQFDRHISEFADKLTDFTPEEFETIAQTGLAINEHTAAMTTVNTLLDMLSLEEKLVNFSSTIALLEDITPSLLEHQEFSLAARIAKAFKEQLIAKSEYTPKYKERIERGMKELGSIEKIRKLIYALNNIKKESEEIKSINSYLTLIDRKSIISSLLEILATEKDMTVRKLVSGILINFSRYDISLIGRRVSDPRWFFVRNIVEILGLIRSEEALPYLDVALKHADTRVRKETIRALGIIGGQKALELLLSTLKDSDVAIRQMGAKWIGSTRNPQAIAPLSQIIQKRDPFYRHLIFKKYAIESLGLIGSNEALPILKKVLFKKSLLNKARLGELQEAVAEALRQIGTAEAKEILEKYLKPDHAESLPEE